MPIWGGVGDYGINFIRITLIASPEVPACHTHAHTQPLDYQLFSSKHKMILIVLFGKILSRVFKFLFIAHFEVYIGGGV